MSGAEQDREAVLKRLEEQGARVALARGERVLAVRPYGVVELILDGHDRLIETPRPDLTRKPSRLRRTWIRAKLALGRL